MEKLDMKTPNFTDENIAKIAEIFPNCLTEAIDDKGNLTKAIDFDLLRQELSANIVDGQRERYQINWPGKREALIKANEPINKTLRPYREESVNFDTTQNLYIEGDNLEALKLLQESYLGKVKMIYIDPPYNTGNDFIYSDNFTVENEEYNLLSGQKDEEGGKLVANTESNGRFHSDWLSMMYSRMKLARNLLSEDGVVFISIGEEELTNLDKMATEVFGEVNKISTITRIAKTASNLGSHFAPSTDFILCFSKNVAYLQGFVDEVDETLYKKVEVSGDRKGEKFRDDIALYQSSQKDLRKNQKYFIECPDGSKVIPPCEFLDETQREGEGRWRWIKQTALENQHLLVFKETKTSPLLDENGNQAKWNIYTKSYLSDRQETGTRPRNIFDKFINRKGADYLKKLGIPFDFSKPYELILHLVKISNISNDDIILDFFSGSATTADAVMQLNANDGKNRKFIMVQLPEEMNDKSEAYKAGYKTICDIGKERIRRAGKKIKEDNAGKKWIESLDIGFRVLKIDSSNMKDVYYTPDQLNQQQLSGTVENIKEDRTAEDLLFQVLLDWGVDLMLPIVREEILGKTVFFVDGNTLAACFDDGIDEAFVKELAKREVMRVVFKDSGFKEDDTKGNVDQIFAQLSPDTEVRAI